MATIELKCYIRLNPAIMVWVQEQPFTTLAWITLNGEKAALTPRIENSQICGLVVELEVHDITVDELQRLNGIHPTAGAPLFGIARCQSAPDLAERVSTIIRDATNQVLRHIRDYYGYYWLRLLEPHSAGGFLYWARTKWRAPGQEWAWFFPAPLPVLHPPGLHYGKHDYFMSAAEWQDVQSALATHDEPSIGYSFIVDAQERYRQGDKRFAIVQLNAALEWTAREFVGQVLATKLPNKSLAKVLRQNYDALLRDWMLPLADEHGITLSGTKEWEAVFEIKTRRNEIAHPTTASNFPPLTDELFFELVSSAVKVMASLLGMKPPKRPGPFYMECNHDDLPVFFQRQ